MSLVNTDTTIANHAPKKNIANICSAMNEMTPTVK
jgi:hypothetical protein